MIKCEQILMDALLYLMCEIISVCSAGNLSLKSQLKKEKKAPFEILLCVELC